MGKTCDQLKLQKIVLVHCLWYLVSPTLVGKWTLTTINNGATILGERELFDVMSIIIPLIHPLEKLDRMLSVCG